MIYMKPCVPARYALGSAALLTRKGRKGGGSGFWSGKEKEERNATVAKRKWEEKMVVTHVPKIYCPKATLGEK